MEFWPEKCDYLEGNQKGTWNSGFKKCDYQRGNQEEIWTSGLKKCDYQEGNKETQNFGSKR